jgi:Protein of unknown function (DUF3343)
MEGQKLSRVVAFYTTADAFAFKSACAKHGISGRLITIPRELSAGCGLAWRSPANEGVHIDKLIETKKIEIEIMCDMNLL